MACLLEYPGKKKKDMEKTGWESIRKSGGEKKVRNMLRWLLQNRKAAG